MSQLLDQGSKWAKLNVADQLPQFAFGSVQAEIMTGPRRKAPTHPGLLRIQFPGMDINTNWKALSLIQMPDRPARVAIRQ